MNDLESRPAIGMKTFGASAPLKELQKRFGFEPEQVVAVAKELLAKELLSTDGSQVPLPISPLN